MEPTPYCERTSTNIASPARTWLAGPRKKFWWHCGDRHLVNGTRRLETTRLGTASRISTTSAPSSARPRHRCGRSAGPRTRAPGAPGSPGRQPSARQPRTWSRGGRRTPPPRARRSPATAQSKRASGASDRGARPWPRRCGSKQHRRGDPAPERSPAAKSTPDRRPTGARWRAVDDDHDPSPMPSSATSPGWTRALGPVAIRSVSRGDDDAHGTSTAKATRKISVSASWWWGGEGGGSSVIGGAARGAEQGRGAVPTRAATLSAITAATGGRWLSAPMSGVAAERAVAVSSKSMPPVL